MNCLGDFQARYSEGVFPNLCNNNANFAILCITFTDKVAPDMPSMCLLNLLRSTNNYAPSNCSVKRGGKFPNPGLHGKPVH